MAGGIQSATGAMYDNYGPYGPCGQFGAPGCSTTTPLSPITAPTGISQNSFYGGQVITNPGYVQFEGRSIQGADSDKVRNCLFGKNSKWPLRNDPACPTTDLSKLSACIALDNNAKSDFDTCVTSTGARVDTVTGNGFTASTSAAAKKYVLGLASKAFLGWLWL